jgi:hypothetical protein
MLEPLIGQKCRALVQILEVSGPDPKKIVAEPGDIGVLVHTDEGEGVIPHTFYWCKTQHNFGCWISGWPGVGDPDVELLDEYVYVEPCRSGPNFKRPSERVYMGDVIPRQLAGIRKVRADEVEFDYDVSEDGDDVRGNVMASGDDEADAKAENEVIVRLAQGDIWAWCSIKTTATWTAPNGTKLVGTLWVGGHSFKDREQFESGDELRDYRVEALDDLNTRIRDTLLNAHQLKEVLTAR